MSGQTFDYHVRLSATSPYTRVAKALAHLKRSLHWSRYVTAVRALDDDTIGVIGIWPDLADSVRLFSHYYPHVRFEVTTHGLGDVAPQVFQATKQL